MKFKFIFRTVFTNFLSFFRIKNIIRILSTFIIKFISLKNVSRIIFLFLTGWLLRFMLINYCDVNVFRDYDTLYANLYYIFMATLSVMTLEIFSGLPNWSDIFSGLPNWRDIFNWLPNRGDIFKWVKKFIKYCQKDKMVIGPSSRYYGDASSIGRKSVCSMNSASGTNNAESSSNTSNANNNTTSDRSSTGESDSGEESETEMYGNKIRRLQTRIQEFRLSIQRLNDPVIRAIANKMDRNIPLTAQESETWYSTINTHVHNIRVFRYDYIHLGYNNALDLAVGVTRNRIIRVDNVIYRYNQTILEIIAERQNRTIQDILAERPNQTIPEIAAEIQNARANNNNNNNNDNNNNNNNDNNN